MEEKKTSLSSDVEMVGIEPGQSSGGKRNKVIPRMTRRCLVHDYRSASTYMITLSRHSGFKCDFCRVFDAGKEAPDYASAKIRSESMTPDISRIRLYPRIPDSAGGYVPASQRQDEEAPRHTGAARADGQSPGRHTDEPRACSGYERIGEKTRGDGFGECGDENRRKTGK